MFMEAAMKCIIHVTDGRVDRAANDEAANCVASQWWNYCPKHLWKGQRKDTEKGNEQRIDNSISS